MPSFTKGWYICYIQLKCILLIMSSPTKNKKSKRKRVGHAREVLEAIGQDSEKEGIKWTKYFMDKWNRKQWKENQIKKEKLEKKRKYTKMEYFRALAGMLHEEAQFLEAPPNYDFWAEFSGDGVVLKMRSPSGKTYQRAFKPDGTPELDYKAVVSILVSALDTVHHVEEEKIQKIKDQGFILPS